jgi:hypothetical protein
MLAEIIDLIESKMGKYKVPITKTTCLEKDLGISGDDAAELLLEYGQKFNVDLTGLKLAKYFNPECDSILPEIIRFFTNKNEDKEKEMRVGDLEKGIVAGRLDETIINSSIV